MSPIKWMAAGLLVERVYVVVVAVIILYKQSKLLKLMADRLTTIVRWVLFGLMIFILLNQIIPIALDTAVLIEQRDRNPDGLGVAYAFNNATGQAVQITIILMLYIIIERYIKRQKQ